MASIKLSNVSKSYTSGSSVKYALDNISLTCKSGTINGVIGASGAGKSTLLRSVNLLERPSCGAIYVDDTNLLTLNNHKLQQMRHKIGMIFQHFNLFNTYSVQDNILFPLNMQGVKFDRKAFDEIIELTNLGAHLLQYPAELSGGQKQRVAIARALITNPQIILSDEATSALDPNNTANILNLLKTINREKKITILLITHEMQVVRSICDTTFVLDAGKLIEQGATLELFLHPKEAVTRKLLEHDDLVKLPQSMQQQVAVEPSATHSQPLFRLAFLHSAAIRPLIASLYQQHGIMLNILQGEIYTINQEIIGSMLCKLEKSEQHTAAKIIEILASYDITTEIIGYVPRNF